MKKFTQLFLAGLFSLAFLPSSAQKMSEAQEVKTAPRKTPGNSQIQRCGSMQVEAQYLREHPEVVEINRQMREQIEKLRGQQESSSGNRIQAIVNIPIVFHIVLPNPYIISDADIQAQVNRLNLDYSGLNPDSTNVPASFQAVRGHSQLRFCLAQRTPTGQPTNGIERRASSTLYNATSNDPIKSTAAGGLDVWDYTQYFNIWVGTGGGLLGYATFPGTSTPSQQGVVTDIIGTSNNPCYVDPSYNMGRTLTHEAGHYFGLYHIWGDEAGCTNNDFRNLSGTCLLPASLGGTATDQTVGDTPNQGDENYGCPGGTVANSCGNTAGDMYQNYMDYTDDACMTMFTNKQAERMEWIVANCRSGYLTSLGCSPPATGPSLDAAPVAAINPGGSETSASCVTINYPIPLCPSTIAPKVRITNNGLNTLTSVTVGVRIGTGTPVTVNATGLSLAAGATTIITLPNISLTTGTNQLKFFTSAPNGGTDATPSNDTLTVPVTISAPTAPPMTQDFNTAATSIAPWSITSSSGSPVWQIALPAGAPPSSVGPNVYSAVIDNYNFDGLGKKDDINSGLINLTGVTTLDIKFDVAYWPYAAGTSDSLVVLISKDCGATFTEVYRKGGTGLGTKAGFSGNVAFTPANSGEWRTETITLTPAQLSGGSNLLVKFRNIARYGNRLWLDNINIAPPISIDISANAIVRPNTLECGPFAPTLTVRNSGGVALTGFKAGYILNNGTPVTQAVNTPLAPGATTNVTFPAITAPGGNSTIKLFVADPLSASGPVTDAVITNDTLTRTFQTPVAQPFVSEGFEGATFAPAGWSIVNADANLTWERTTPGKASGFSAYVNNYNYTNLSGVYIYDMLQAPYLNVTNADSVIVEFDVAHKYYQDPGGIVPDRLSVLAFVNCATTSTLVYDKSGPVLATAGSAGTAEYLNPAQSDWRRERVSLSLGAGITTLSFQFRNGNAWGNNIFIDNINITPKFKRDLKLVSLEPPLSCAATNATVATILNNGSETITGYTIGYTINGGTPVTSVVTGVNLLKNTTATFTLPALPVGANVVKIYSFAPIAASGTGDQFLFNDTLTRTIYVAGTAQSPLVEGFEGTFPPTGWGITNPDNSLTWQKAGVGRLGTGSAQVRTFAYFNPGQRDALYSPVLQYTGVDSLNLTFDVSAATKDFPGSTTIAMDTLEVLVTRDCGNTFTSVYKKWGLQLQTLGSNSGLTTEFTPLSSYVWRKESINLGAFVPAGPLQVVFRVTNNQQNDIYIDNVNLEAKTFPANLRAAGYVINPSPFTNSFNIWFIQPPTDLKYVSVFNSAGQLLWKREFNSNQSNVINVDLTGKAAGIYIVKFGYAGKEVEQKVLKVN